MVPSGRQISGRSPLVDAQRQITAFVGKSAASSSPTPSPFSSKKTPKSNPNPNPSSPSPSSLPNKKTPKSNPNPISDSDHPARSPSPCPASPSPVQCKLKKLLLVIGQTPSPPKSAENTYGADVVGKQVRVYTYDDGEEESLDLGKEKIEWVVGAKSGARFKRLRRGASAFRIVATDDDGAVEETGHVNKSDADDSSDEDWGKNVGKAVCESEEDDVELEDEEIPPKVNRVSKTDSRKRKTSQVAKSGGGKKSRTDKETSVVESAKKTGEADRVVKGLDDNTLDGDALARFGALESENFRFLRVDRVDANRRRPTDEKYDPRTLLPHADFVKRLTGGQRQGWEFKSKHVDKVVFFKMGKFYELFEADAHVGAKELDLQYMKGELPHSGFPEKNFSVNIEKLVKKSYRDLVVEQTETPDMLERRPKEKGSKDKAVKPEICAIVTRGTLTDGEMLLTNPDASYLMALTEGGESLTDQDAEHNFGVCLVDVAITLGQFKDDQDCSALSSVLSEIRPVEIIKQANVLSSSTERTIVRHTRNTLVNSLYPEKTIHEVGIFRKRISCQPSSAHSGEGKILGDGSLNNESVSSFLPKMLSELATGEKNGSLAISALGGAIYYLRQAFLDESLLRFAKFESLPYCDANNFTEKQHMVLDAAALEHPEIFENIRNGGSLGTLNAQLNQCVSASGKRLLKTWLAGPLHNPELIKERQDAVAILRQWVQMLDLAPSAKEEALKPKLTPNPALQNFFTIGCEPGSGSGKREWGPFTGQDAINAEWAISGAKKADYLSEAAKKAALWVKPWETWKEQLSDAAEWSLVVPPGRYISVDPGELVLIKEISIVPGNGEIAGAPDCQVYLGINSDMSESIVGYLNGTSRSQLRVSLHLTKAFTLGHSGFTCVRFCGYRYGYVPPPEPSQRIQPYECPWPLSIDLTAKVMFRLNSSSEVANAELVCKFFRAAGNHGRSYANIDLCNKMFGEDLTALVCMRRTYGRVKSLAIGHYSPDMIGSSFGSLYTRRSLEPLRYLGGRLKKLKLAGLLFVSLNYVMQVASSHCKKLDHFTYTCRFVNDPVLGQVSEGILEAFIRSCPRVSSLALHAVDLSDSKLAIILQGLKKLVSLDISHSKGFTGSFLIEAGKNGAEKILQVLQLEKCVNLQEVQLSMFFMRLRDDVAFFFPNLKELIVIGDESTEELRQGFVERMYALGLLEARPRMRITLRFEPRPVVVVLFDEDEFRAFQANAPPVEYGPYINSEDEEEEEGEGEDVALMGEGENGVVLLAENNVADVYDADAEDAEVPLIEEDDDPVAGVVPRMRYIWWWQKAQKDESV